jgi:uncharacterized protein
MEILPDVFEFEWDQHNISHISRHGISFGECEQIFFNVPLQVSWDESHSHLEIRRFALGKTDSGKILVVIFTVRKEKTRVVTARVASRRERRIYEKTQKNSKI